MFLALIFLGKSLLKAEARTRNVNGGAEKNWAEGLEQGQARLLGEALGVVA